MLRLRRIYSEEELQSLAEVAADCKKELLLNRIYCMADSPRDKEITRKVNALTLLLADIERATRIGAG